MVKIVIYMERKVCSSVIFSGPQMPIGLYGQSMVPFGLGQAILGGENGDTEQRLLCLHISNVVKK